MLPRPNRLPLRMLPNFFTQSEKYFTTELTFFVRRSPELAQPQIAFILPKKVLPKSTQRHFFKRQLTEIVRPHLGTLPPWQIAIVASKKMTSHTSIEQLQKSFSNFLQKLT